MSEMAAADEDYSADDLICADEAAPYRAADVKGNEEEEVLDDDDEFTKKPPAIKLKQSFDLK
jgi:hypothetical protein